VPEGVDLSTSLWFGICLGLFGSSSERADGLSSFHSQPVYASHSSHHVFSSRYTMPHPPPPLPSSPPSPPHGIASSARGSGSASLLALGAVAVSCPAELLPSTDPRPSAEPLPSTDPLPQFPLSSSFCSSGAAPSFAGGGGSADSGTPGAAQPSQRDAHLRKSGGERSERRGESGGERSERRGESGGERSERRGESGGERSERKGESGGVEGLARGLA
jgi:hypothetical protein